MASLMKGAVGVNSASRLEFRVWCAGVGTRLGAWARREGGREDGSERGRQGGICRRMAWGRLIQAEPRADLRVARRSVAHRGVARHNPSHFSLGQCLQCLLRAESVAWENGSSRKNTCPNIEYARARARASEPSADSAPSGSSELDRRSPPAEGAHSSTSCASLMLFSSCGTAGRNRASGRVQAAAGRRRAHHVWEDNEGYDLVHVKLEQHAGDLSGARRIHRLPHARGAGIPVWFLSDERQ